ncbi:TY1B-NL2 [Symbiodinium sp. CCMP2592]|nr:TY1B-NL2 [Symbiodinium sp. CCMP2592]
MNLKFVILVSSTLANGTRLSLGKEPGQSSSFTAPHLHYKDRDTLEFAGFPIGKAQWNDQEEAFNEPATTGLSSQQVELHLLQTLPTDEQGTFEDSMLTMTEDQEQLVEDLEERSARLRLLLEEEEALAEECRRAGQQTVDEVENVRATIEEMISDLAVFRRKLHDDQKQRCLRAAVVAQEVVNYERLLDELKGDLEVVHTVPLDQVRAALPKWHQAMAKEVNQLLDGTLRPMTLAMARDLEKQGKLKLVPSKAVCTLKPPTNKGEKARRRFRLVLFGNFVSRDDPSYNLYAGGVSAETVRLALTIAGALRWTSATSDIVAAFLLASWSEELARYAIYPPRMLIEAGFISADQGITGCLEQVQIDEMASARIPWKGKIVVLKPGDADPDLWLAYDEEDKVRAQGSLLALVITYVDDLLYLAEKSLVEAIHEWIQKDWPCSPLEWAQEPGGTRYLGMELRQREDYVFEISQEGYIRELLRNHSMDDAVSTRLPCPKEWVHDGEPHAEPENYSMEELKLAQRIVGGAALADYAFSAGSSVSGGLYGVESYTSTEPSRPNRAEDPRLPQDNSSSKAGHGIGWSWKGRTYGTGWVFRRHFIPARRKVLRRQRGDGARRPVAWKASKQSFVTLSVMEAELYETANAVVLLESVGSLLDEILGYQAIRRLKVDNSSALSMVQGGPGSWRTRHLKVRSAKIRSLVETGELLVEHTTGDLQLADLATNMHSKMRFWELLTLWGFKDLPQEAVQALNTKSAYMAMLVLALMISPAQADDGTTPARTGLQAVGADELMLVTLLVSIAAVLAEEPCGSSEVPSPQPPPPDPHPIVRAKTTKKIIDTPAAQQFENEFEIMPERGYYKTNSSRSNLHTDPHCHGLRNSGDVYAVEYCAYCQRNTPLYSRRSRSLQPSRSY